jgi:hypothetical protein
MCFLGVKLCCFSKQSLPLWKPKIEKKKKIAPNLNQYLSSFYIWHSQELIMFSSSVSPPQFGDVAKVAIIHKLI